MLMQLQEAATSFAAGLQPCLAGAPTSQLQELLLAADGPLRAQMPRYPMHCPLRPLKCFTFPTSLSALAGCICAPPLERGLQGVQGNAGNTGAAVGCR